MKVSPLASSLVFFLSLFFFKSPNITMASQRIFWPVSGYYQLFDVSNLVTADVNGDGLPDAAVSNEGDGTLSV